MIVRSDVQLWFPVETERLCLRELCASDRDGVYECAADPDSIEFLVWSPRDVLNDTESVLSEWHNEGERSPRRCAVVAIERSRDRQLAGIISLSMSNAITRSVCLGYVVGSKYRGLGYATEAGRAAIDIAFSRMAAKRVFAVCDTKNGASRRVVEKLALRRETLIVGDRVVHGRWRDSLVYAVRLERYRASRRAMAEFG